MAIMFLNLHIIKSNIRPHISCLSVISWLSTWWKHMVTLILLRVLFGYVWVSILALSPQRGMWTKTSKLDIPVFNFQGLTLITTLHTESPDYLLCLSSLCWDGYLGGGDWLITTDIYTHTYIYVSSIFINKAISWELLLQSLWSIWC